MANQKMWPKDQSSQLSDQKIGWQKEKWSPRRKSGLPPLYHLPNEEDKVCTKNKLKRMQDKSLGGTARSREPQKLVSGHQKWSMTTKVVSQTTVAL